MDDLEKDWEERSRKYGRKIEGVLTKSLPLAINLYIDDWMFDQVSKVLVDTKKKVKILDLGCGYGRLSRRLLEKFSNVSTFGVDIAQRYVDIYNEDLNPRGRAIKADIRSLPFRPKTFDAVIMVTAFLYLKKKSEQKKCLLKIFKLLKHEGRFVFIERNLLGYSIITAGGLISVLRGKNNQEIPAVGFDSVYLSRLIHTCGGKIEEIQGVPAWTLLLPLLVLISFLNKKLEKLSIKTVKFLDRKFLNYPKLSVYISWSGTV